jgi:CHAT domain-containing protein
MTGVYYFLLCFAKRETRASAQLFPKAAMLLKEQATKAKTVSLAPTHDVLHFATHAEYKENDPMSSALLLARDGRKAGEVFALNLKAYLVVLPACARGLGKISIGDEIIGLTRAFIYAGTTSVITTLWKVDDRASYKN